MIDPATFMQSYEALKADPRWQTGFHDPITGGDDLWDRFLSWIAHVHFQFGVIWIIRLAIIGLVFFIRLRKKQATLAAQPIIPPPPQTIVAPKPAYRDPASIMADADRLAAAGQFLNAASLLLEAGIASAARFAAASIGPAVTPREIGALPLSPSLSASFRRIGQTIERGRFAEQSIDAETYAACRAACDLLVDQRSWAV